MPNWPSYQPGRIYPSNRFYQKVVVPAVTVKTLFSTSLVICPGSPGYVIIPILFHVRKLAGAYTLNASTKLRLRWNGFGGDLSAIATAGFIDQAGDLTDLCFGPSQGGVVAYGDIGLVNSAAGLGLIILNDVANWSGNGGDLEVTVLFSVVPLIMPFTA